MTRRKTTEEFIAEAKAVHEDKYDYSKVNYTTNHNKVLIICPTHGEFSIRPNHHLSHKVGCSRCGGTGKVTIEEFIETSTRIFNSKYDYSLVKPFKNVRSKVTIVCPEHGTFEQGVQVHMNGHHCPKCGLRRPKEEWISLFKQKHGNKYEYDLDQEYCSNLPIRIKCPIHGWFNTTPSNHLMYQCKSCGFEICRSANEIYLHSLVEKEFSHLSIQSNSYPEELQCAGLKGGDLEIDIYIPELGIGIEWNGIHWHKGYKEIHDNIKKDIMGNRLLQITNSGRENKDFVDFCYINKVKPFINQHLKEYKCK